MTRDLSEIAPRAGHPWTPTEDAQLFALCDGTHTLAQIAAKHGRTVAGIRARIERHGLYCTLPHDPCTVRELATGSIAACCLKAETADRIVTALNRETHEDALTHSLIAALKALHGADVNGGVSMADLRSIAIQRCRHVVARVDSRTAEGSTE